VGFIVTSLAASSRAVVRFYNKRGTAEQWIKQPSITRSGDSHDIATAIKEARSILYFNRTSMPGPLFVCKNGDF
jgi:hypothetical protein